MAFFASGCAGSKSADAIHSSSSPSAYVKTNNLSDLIALELNHNDTDIKPSKKHGKNRAQRSDFDIPFVMNDKVQNWIDIFTGTLRDKFTLWLERGGRYMPYMEHVLDSYHMPKDIIYLSMIESGLNPNAYSHANAAGLWQFIRGTGKLYGLQNGRWVDERFDLIKETHAAARHLRDLYSRYGDWYLAFAAYNAGAGKIDRAIAITGSQNFWTISKTSTIRQETKDYVPRILAAAYISKHPEKYGFNDLNRMSSLEFETIRVDGGLDMETASRCASVDLDWMKTMNAELVHGITPPGEKYPLRIPMGTSDAFEKAYAALTPEDKNRFAIRYSKSQRGNAKERAFALADRPLTHRVKRHETLALIAAHYGVSSSELLHANHLRSAHVRIGQRLRIPTDTGATLYATHSPELDSKIQAELTTPRARSTVAKANALQNTPPRASLAKADKAQPPHVYYKVRKGDTLWNIAKVHSASLNAIKQLNASKLGRRSEIKVGMVLVIPNSNS